MPDLFGASPRVIPGKNERSYNAVIKAVNRGYDTRALKYVPTSDNEAMIEARRLIEETDPR